jgi:hypothetical protein
VIDREAERDQALKAGLGDGLARVLDAVTTLVLVDVVRLAVGEEQEKSVTSRLARQQRADVANAAPTRV